MANGTRQSNRLAPTYVAESNYAGESYVIDPFDRFSFDKPKLVTFLRLEIPTNNPTDNRSE